MTEDDLKLVREALGDCIDCLESLPWTMRNDETTAAVVKAHAALVKLGGEH